MNGVRPVTVVVRGRRVRQWGFRTRSGWIPWAEYKEQPPGSAGDA